MKQNLNELEICCVSGFGIWKPVKRKMGRFKKLPHIAANVAFGFALPTTVEIIAEVGVAIVKHKKEKK